MQVGENEPFVSELLTTLPATIADLEPHQIHSFYESVSQVYVTDTLFSSDYLVLYCAFVTFVVLIFFRWAI